MTALTEHTGREIKDGDLVVVGIAASQTIYTGVIVELDADGHARAARKGTGKKYFGVAERGGTGTTTAGAATALVRRNTTFRFSYTGTQPDVGDTVYVEDDNTVTLVSTGATAFGIVIEVDNDTSTVFVEPWVPQP